MSDSDVSARLDRVEAALERLTALLEQRHVATPTPSDSLSKLMLELGDPESLDALARIAALAPQLEYAAYLAAAGPELLDEALVSARKMAEDSGLGAFEVQRRLTRAVETAIELSSGGRMELVKRVAEVAPHYLPLAEAAASALQQRGDFEGHEDLQRRMTEAFLELSDPETQEALVRLANLAPQLEYAAGFVAAGPELLEEAMELARSKASEHGIDPHVIVHRLNQATDLLLLFTGSEQIETLRELGRSAPHMRPVLRATAEVLGQRAALEGEASLESRLYEVLLELSDEETLSALTRIAALAPQLEYAAYFAAAGPELLEETMDGVRTWARRQDVADVDQRLEAGLEALTTLSTPPTLRGLAQVSTILASISDTPDTSGALQRLVNRLPRVERTVNQVERALDMLDSAAEESGIGTIEELEKPTMTGLRLLKQATQPDTLEALEMVIELAPNLAKFAKPLLTKLDGIDPEDVSRLLDMVRSMPVKEDTLRFLRAANEATAAAFKEPATPVGMFGLLGALQDQDVQRTLGFGVRLSRHLASSLHQSKQLEARPPGS
ncbi:MAG: DUF1641 domain-containing protein [Myxococcota bacterium]